MHYAIVFLCTTYQANFGASASAGITIADPVIGSLRLRGEHAWYYFLLVLVTLVTVGCVNLVRTRPGRAWMAIRDRDIAAEALGDQSHPLQARGLHVERNAGFGVGQSRRLL